MKVFVRMFFLLCLSSTFAGCITTDGDFSIGPYKLVSVKKSGRTTVINTLRARIQNNGPDAQNVTATLTLNSPHASVIDGVVSFGDLKAGESKISLDTFSIKSDLRHPPNGSSYRWTIRAKPRLTVSANPKSIVAGQPCTLTWDSTYAESCTIDQGIGGVMVDGSVFVSPPHTTTYTITATGPNGTTTSAVAVSVTSQTPEAHLSASPNTIFPGGSSILSWTSSNANSASIEPGIGSVDPNGSIVISPAYTTTYVFSIAGPGGTATASMEIVVLKPPSDVDIGLDTEEQQGGGGLMSNRVRIINGNALDNRTDLQFPSSNSLGFTLQAYYNSRSNRSGDMGFGWTHNYEMALDLEYAIGDLHLVRIMDATGRAHYFREQSQGHYVGVFHERTKVILGAEGYVWHRLDGTKQCFNSAGQVLWVEDEKGNRLAIVYNAQSKISAVTDQCSGRSFMFNYNSDARLVSVSGPMTSAVPSGYWVTFYGYDAIGNLVGVTYADGSGFAHTYNDPTDVHNLTEKRDKSGHLLASWSYDGQDRVIGHGSTNGKGISVLYQNSSLLHVTDAYGIQRSYMLGQVGGRTRVFSVSGTANAPYSEGNVIRWLYDGEMNLVEVENAGGRIDRYLEYDSRGNPGTVVLSAGTSLERIIQYTYHADMNRLLTRAERSVLGTGNKVTIWDYDDDVDADPNEAPTRLIHRIIEQGYTKDSLGSIRFHEYVTALNYDSKGRIISIDGPRSGSDDITAFGYDANTGDLLSVTQALIGTTLLSNYDAAGRPSRVTNVNGQSKSYQYDGRGRLTRITNDVDASFTETTYDLSGQPQSITDPDSVSQAFEYDAAYGWLVRIIDPQGNYIQYQYDSQGNRAEMTKHEASGSRTSRKRWDYLHEVYPGKLYKEINADESFIRYEYDEEGNTTGVLDANGHLTSYEYDLFNRVTKVTQPGDAVTTYGYDSHGNLVSVIDAEGHETQYSYDDMGRIIQVSSPDTGSTSYTYDPAGNLVGKTDAKGVTVTYLYDALNRLTAVQFPDTAQNIAYTYDSGTNGKGHLTGMADQSGTMSLVYDARGRLTQKTSTIEGRPYTFTQTFTPGDKVIRVTYPSGRTLDYTRDSLKRMQGLSTSYNSNTANLVSNMSYKPFGGPKGMSTGAGGVVDNQAGECDCITVANPGSMMEQRYAYDKNRNLVSIIAPSTPQYNQSFTYDALNRLQSAQGRYGNTSFTYDKAGNRLSETANGRVDNYTCIPNTNRLQQITGANPIAFTYDANGNITGLGARTLIYNQDNRLIRVEENGTPIGTYTYNAKGERVKKVAGSNTTIYHYDFDGKLIAESTSTGAITNEYLYMGQIRMAMVDVASQKLYYYVNDRLGTPQMMTDHTGKVVWEGFYKPFGDAIVHPKSTVVNNIRFPGQYYDSETGLHYNYHRYYQPRTGRYVTPDPLHLGSVHLAKQSAPVSPALLLYEYYLSVPQAINIYSYVQNNPLNLVDPYGLIEIPWYVPNRTAVKVARERAATLGYDTSKFSDKTILDMIGFLPKEEAAHLQDLWNRLPDQGKDLTMEEADNMIEITKKLKEMLDRLLREFQVQGKCEP